MGARSGDGDGESVVDKGEIEIQNTERGRHVGRA